MSWFSDLKNYTVTLDMGTYYTRMWRSDRNNIVLRCPTAAAIDSHTHQVVALGSEACRMLGKTPENILAYRPLSDGLVNDFEVTSRMITGFFDAKDICTLFRRPAVIAAAPCSLDQVHRLALENAILEAGARSVAVVPSVLAAAAGEGLNIRSSRAHLVMSMGGGVTDVAVISSGNVINAKSLRIAGDRFNMAIASYVKSKYDLIISSSEAENLKLRLGTADKSIDRGTLVTHGRNARSQMADSREITSADICEAVTPSIDAIARLVLMVLGEAPHELERELYDLGVMVTGGSVLLPGLGKALSKKTGLRVTMAEDPLDAVIKGVAKIAKKPELLAEPLNYRRR